MPAHRRSPASGRRARIVLACTGVAVLVVGGAALVLTLGSGSGSGGAHRPRPAIPARVEATTTTLPLLSAMTIENARAGTPDWTVQHPSTAGQIEGYASAVSAQQGDTVTLYVTSTAPSWTATAYRMGWYGGVLARQVWQSGPQAGVRQAAAAIAPETHLVTTTWTPSLEVPITPDWPPGDYLFKLVSSTGWDSYVPLTIRDDASTASILVINSVTTWQAYNLWDGYDLYSGPGKRPGADRATMVSFDRPYRLGDGSGDFLGNEERFVKLVEREGLDVSYTTDVDLAERPQLLLQHRVIVSLGHDEYYSSEMRDAVTAARDHGVNLVYLGANAVYRHIRLQPSPLGPDRVEVNYRVARLDPLNGTDPADVTVQWRDPPNNDPESTLLGEMYQCNRVLAPMVVTDPHAWVFSGLGFTAGQQLGGLVGSEYDHWSPAEHQPPGSPVQLMAQSPVVCRGVHSTSDLTYYVAPSGAGVLDAGTNLWVPSILSDADPALGNTVARITLTILRDASAGPLGHTHPAAPTPVVGPQGNAPAGE